MQCEFCEKESEWRCPFGRTKEQREAGVKIGYVWHLCDEHARQYVATGWIAPLYKETKKEE